MTATIGYIWEKALFAVMLMHARLRAERAQTLAEYSLLITVISVAVVVSSMLLFRTSLAGAFSDATDCISRVSC